MKKTDPHKYTFEPQIQVRAHSLICYEICHPRPERTYKKFDKPTYSGAMTEHAAKRIRKAIDIFLQMSPERVAFNPVSKKYIKFRLAFVTLTVSQTTLITPTEGYEKLLAPWLRWIRRKHRCQYVWKGELQKRGQPHWHVTINSTVHMNDIRDEWNNLQRRAGYLEEFKAKFGHDKPPSTEVKSVRNARKIALYLGKEFCKSTQQTGWKGKVWGCSEEIRMGSFFTFNPQDMDDTRLQAAIKSGTAAKILKERITIYDAPDALELLDDERRRQHAAHVKGLKNIP
jgi:hypothetical protein